MYRVWCVDSWCICPPALLASVGKFQRLSVAHVATTPLLIVNTQLIGFTNISSMECPQEAPAAHRGGDGGVQGGDGGVGAAHHAQVMRLFTCFDNPLSVVINKILTTETEN